jgi:hypothetical protein
MSKLKSKSAPKMRAKKTPPRPKVVMDTKKVPDRGMSLIRKIDTARRGTKMFWRARGLGKARQLVKSAKAEKDEKKREEMYDEAEKHYIRHTSKLKLSAGGPGSGCHGDNCGRHAGGRGEDKTHVPKDALVDRNSRSGNTHSNLSKAMDKGNEIAHHQDNRTIAHADEKRYYRDYQRAPTENNKFRLNQARTRLDEAEKGIKQARSEQKELLKTAKHDEHGKFTRVPSSESHLGGNSTLYKSPSGDSVRAYRFGGFSMQRVAPHSSVEWKDSKSGQTFKQEWHGHSSAHQMNSFLDTHFGIK